MPVEGAACGEVLDLGPGPPAVGLLDLQPDAAREDGALGEAQDLVGVGGAGAEEFGCGGAGLDGADGVGADPADAVDGVVLVGGAAYAQPAQDPGGGLVVVERRRAVQAAAAGAAPGVGGEGGGQRDGDHTGGGEPAAGVAEHGEGVKAVGAPGPFHSSQRKPGGALTRSPARSRVGSWVSRARRS